MPKELILLTVTALLVSGLFLAVFGLGLGFLFMFLPSLPLFALGLGKRPTLALNAALAAAVIISVVAGVASGILFLLFLGFPAWYLAKESLVCRDEPGGRQWMPIGLMLTRLTLCACIAVALMTLYYVPQPGGLPQLLSQNIREAFADLHEDYGDIIDDLANRWSFMVFAITIWLWGLALYAHAWLINRILASKGLEQRPSFSIEVFELPHWMPSLLAICALASLIGSPSMSFLGKSIMISLLLPYFFQGAALMHQASTKWPSRRFFLFFIYFMVFAQFWPALIISGIGLGQQIKRLSGASSWFKS
jgi:hypothetical protein